VIACENVPLAGPAPPRYGPVPVPASSRRELQPGDTSSALCGSVRDKAGNNGVRPLAQVTRGGHYPRYWRVIGGSAQIGTNEPSGYSVATADKLRTGRARPGAG
jgi:hypothetical protein